jgi:phosphoglycolate phosphatase-like HAD superfamily hydrolase
MKTVEGKGAVGIGSKYVTITTSYEKEFLKKVIRDHNLVKSVYIGDTAGDQQAAAGAGIPFIQVLYGFGPDLSEKYKAHNFEEVPGLVEQALN